MIFEPKDLATAEALANEDPFQFQQWAVRKLGGGDVRRGADRGIDGRLYFADDPTRKLKHIVVSVKAGRRLTPAFVRELQGTVERDKAAMGILVTSRQPTKAMEREALACGPYKSLVGKFPRIQIIIAQHILDKVVVDCPALVQMQTFRKAMGAALDPTQMQFPGILK